MSEQRRFGESDHEALTPDDVLSKAIGELRKSMPAQDLWPGVAGRIGPPVRRQIVFTLPQLAMAASLLIAVASGLTWLATTRQPAAVTSAQPVVLAQGESVDAADGQVLNANFADAQFNAAVSDLERILREERERLDPRTVLVIERNLKAIDAAINEARMALNNDPANPYLNSHLADARRRKLDLLRRATELASSGGE